MMMNNSISEVLALVEIFRQATPNSITALASCGTIRHLCKGEQLFLDKELVETIYIVVSGLVSLYKVNYQGGKEHIGYIVDRTGFQEFAKWALKDVHLREKAEICTPVYWNGVKY